MIQYRVASGFVNDHRSFHELALEALLQFELEVLKHLYKQPTVALVI